MLIHLGDGKDFKKIVSENKLVLVDFYATWCGPCKMLSPILEEVASEHDDVVVLKIDTDDNIDLAEQFSVMSIPTMVLFKDGKPVNKKVGYAPKQDVLDFIYKS